MTGGVKIPLRSGGFAENDVVENDLRELGEEKPDVDCRKPHDHAEKGQGDELAVVLETVSVNTHDRKFLTELFKHYNIIGGKSKRLGGKINCTKNAPAKSAI